MGSFVLTLTIFGLCAMFLLGYIIGRYNPTNKNDDEEVDDVVVGSKWHFKNNDPWSYPITIIDIKNGWVKYKHPDGYFDWSMEIGDLKRDYRKI